MGSTFLKESKCLIILLWNVCLSLISDFFQEKHMSRTIRNKKNEKRRYTYRGRNKEFTKFDSSYEYFDMFRFARYSIGSVYFDKYFNQYLEEGWETGWHNSPYVLRRKKTKADIYYDKHLVNGESSCANENSPSREYRNNSERSLRIHNRRELMKFKMLEDYEPICYETPKSHLWEWR